MSTTTTGRTSRIGDVGVKAPVKAASTAALTLNGEQTVDGVALVTGNRVLVKDQASSVDNGIYVVDTGAWSRAVDFDGAYDVVNGTLIKVNGGTTNTGFWYAVCTDPAVPGTDAITFTMSSSTLAVITAYAQTLLAAINAAAARTVLALGALAVKNTIATADIDAEAVTYAKMQKMVAQSIMGNVSAVDAVPGAIYFNQGCGRIGGTQIFTQNPAVRQAIYSLGGVTSGGLPSPTITGGTGVGTTSVGITGDVIGSAAFGWYTVTGAFDLTGYITNPLWTGLSTNGTYYLYLEFSGGTPQGVAVTAGSTTLAPVYQEGGTYSTTNNQHTFNISEMTMKVGNGSTATQVYRVFVGEVTVAANVVSAITWYALNGRYDSGWTNTLPTTTTKTSKSHNLGVKPQLVEMSIECLTAESGFAIGDQLNSSHFGTADASTRIMPIAANAMSMYSQTGSTSAFVVVNASGAGAVLTLANWKWRMTAQRGW